MSIPQKSLFSLLSCCQKFLQSVEIWQSSDKKLVCTVFFETRCINLAVKYQISKVLVRAVLQKLNLQLKKFGTSQFS